MPPEKSTPNLAPVTDDSFAHLLTLFMSPANPKWHVPPPRGYSESTKETWGRELVRMARPDTLGAFTREQIRPSLVQAYFDGISDRPGKQAAGLAALRQFEKWAIVRELLPRQITLGVEIGHSDGGHIPWTDEQVEIAAQYARPDIARAVTLCANTGQRGSDLVRMSPNHIEVYKGIEGINVIQQKTGKHVWVPITSPLRAAMDSWGKIGPLFLTNLHGRAWTRTALTSAWSYERRINPKLEQHRNPPQRTPDLAECDPDGLVMHGLRGTACVRLRRSGASESQIADMVGMSIEMVARYCRFSVQRENAVAAVVHLERTFAERNRDMSNKNRS